MITLITNRKMIPYADLVTHLKNCAHPNVERIILREKDLDMTTIQRKIQRIKACRELKSIPLMLNGPYPLGQTYGADGRHYTFDQFMRWHGVRKVQDHCIGVSVHSVEEVLTLRGMAVDYLLYGHVFSTDCKAGLQPRGLDQLEAVGKIKDQPIIPLGGITRDNYGQIIEKGWNCIAMMSSVMENERPYEYLSQFKFYK